MKPAKFKEANVIYGKDENDQLELPALKQDKNIVCAWKMNFIERLICLFTGKVWFLMITRKYEVPATLMTVKKSQLLEKQK
jgi:hypothetical protein